ncbi:hypothetical protein AQUCO_00200501v1 [Aquilegia coerulea]|uniref:Pectate lyase n=1 Tax=Aquilegia coerulea TaxID=218851 RepID=A0A2G5F3I6_AQUCA|nr:hypothetical protein AQUCO_00200501v1 [Aquilegia coerulea]
MGIKINVLCVVFLAFATLALAHIGEFDEYWQKREAEARRVALESYHPEPEEVTNHFNQHVHLALEGNGTRRGLRPYKGKCMATNPIDRCWRCRTDWATDRKRLVKCVLGFGRKTTGGLKGRFYVVTDSSDNDMVNPKPGTLRHAVIQNEPLWIIFERDMTIKLNQELMVNSHKTIDARGAIVHVAYGAGITIQYSHNVIIHGLRIHDINQGSGGFIRDSLDHFGFRTVSDGDAVSVFGSSNIWLDHLSMKNCKDGLIDVVQGSTAITISNCHMTHHNDVFLFGAQDSYEPDKIMQITVAFTHFGKGLVQRMPRCRWGFFHVVNNDYTHWLMYAIGGSSNPTIISQGNRYVAPMDNKAKEATHREKKTDDWMRWRWRSEGDLMKNGAFFVESGTPLQKKPYYKDMIKAKPGAYVGRLTRFSGSLTCKPNKPC